MSTEPQPAPRGTVRPRHASGDEVPTPAEAPVLPGAVYPSEEAVLPGAAEPGAGPAPVEPVPGQPASAEPTPAPPLKIKRTRTSGVWVAVGFFAVILLLLL